jgi:hypothetical protein
MFGSLQPIDIGVGLFCIGFVAFYTGYWFPHELADEGEGRLPKKFLALLLFAGINVVVFLVLVATIHLWRNHEEFGRVLEAAGFDSVASLLASVQDGTVTDLSPLSAGMIAAAAAVFFGLFGFRRWRRIEAGALRQLHNISLIADDARRLSAKLQTGEHRRGDEPANSAMTALDRLQRRVSRREADSPARSLAAKWGKLDALLQLWNDRALWSETLPQVELPNLASIRLAHERRNTLARKVNLHVENVERGEADPAVLASIADLLRREDVSAEGILDQLRGLRLGGNEPADEHSLRVLLEPLVEYFHEEYDEALRHMSDATAKSVVMSGDEAGERLHLLKECGFSGIGDVKVINLHGAVFITFSVFVILLLLFNGYVHFQPESATSGAILATVAGSMTLAVVAGAMVGGLRSLARAETTPWGWYMLTALVMAMLHFIMVFTVYVNAGPGPVRTMEYGVSAFVIGSLLPFSLVLWICLLSRHEMRRRWLPEWLADAVVMALGMALVGAMIVFLAERSGIGSVTPDDPLARRMLRIGGLLALVGACIGALVVHRVRAAALSRVVDDDPAPDAREDAPEVANAPAPERPRPAAFADVRLRPVA